MPKFNVIFKRGALLIHVMLVLKTIIKSDRYEHDRKISHIRVMY